MRLADSRTVGIFPLQHKKFKSQNWDLQLRASIFGVRITDRYMKTGDIGHWEFDKDSLGDIHGGQLWNKDSREIPMWRFATPVKLGKKGPPNSDVETPTDNSRRNSGGLTGSGSSRPGSASTNGSGGGTGGSLASSNAGYNASGGNAVGSTLVGAGQGLLRPTVSEGPGSSKPGDTTSGPGGGGGGGGASPPTCGTMPDSEFIMFPIKDSDYASDERLKEIKPAIYKVDGKRAWPKFPKGYVGISLIANEEEQQIDLFHPTDPRLVAVNKAGDPQMGSLVYDLTKGFEFDKDRNAPLQSMMWVLKKPLGLPNALAWEIGQAGCGDVDGGFVIDQSTGGEGGGTQQESAGKGQARPTVVEQAKPAGKSSRVVAQVSRNWGGPFDVGSGRCRHVTGRDADGNPISRLHFDIATLFRQDDGHDGPLNVTNWKKGDSQDKKIKVQFGWNAGAQKWDWWTTGYVHYSPSYTPVSPTGVTPVSPPTYPNLPYNSPISPVTIPGGGITGGFIFQPIATGADGVPISGGDAVATGGFIFTPITVGDDGAPISGGTAVPTGGGGGFTPVTTGPNGEPISGGDAVATGGGTGNTGGPAGGGTTSGGGGTGAPNNPNGAGQGPQPPVVNPDGTTPSDPEPEVGTNEWAAWSQRRKGRKADLISLVPLMGSVINEPQSYTMVDQALALGQVLAKPYNTYPNMPNFANVASVPESMAVKYANENPITGQMVAFGAQGGASTKIYSNPAAPPPAPSLPPASPNAFPAPAPTPAPPVSPSGPPGPSDVSTQAVQIGATGDPWDYTWKPQANSNYAGGTSPGGWTFNPPEVPFSSWPEDMTAQEGQGAVSETWIGAGPGVGFFAGAADVASGRPKDCMSWSKDTATGDLVFKSHYGADAGVEAFRFAHQAQRIGIKARTTYTGWLQHFATSSREWTFPNASGEVLVGTSHVAVGNSAAATLHSIGGSGPTVANQDSWMKIHYNGTDMFIPLWR